MSSSGLDATYDQFPHCEGRSAKLAVMFCHLPVGTTPMMPLLPDCDESGGPPGELPAVPLPPGLSFVFGQDE